MATNVSFPENLHFPWKTTFIREFRIKRVLTTSKPILILIYLRGWTWKVTPQKPACCGFLRTSVELQQVRFFGTFCIHKALAQGTNGRRHRKLCKYNKIKQNKITRNRAWSSWNDQAQHHHSAVQEIWPYSNCFFTSAQFSAQWGCPMRWSSFQSLFPLKFLTIP